MTCLDGKFDGRLSRLLNKVKIGKHQLVLHLAQQSNLGKT